ncbi:hypothetical protein F11_02165 [Rhodospirillum rubrum F11]|uniref:Uncharacterized protein n=1 Tax=Rhodospirillum rubrum (strain ATCC 11170 / ATH 1.1.1 / DSM 467 / LMG 4362 / NCIMB 8255 / S1) TaxID=269796 RepID=Q2RXB7_RHORT|nr:hypothetical protein [Rhodospirillum rubrum]ABC21228.1 hypothetical protein Rru_A0423 [Rhodospirillum rubrum ATCC 11170]AEO46903.1 hypothetical protein F11_02165 [Rhodospirillum rubrum F11]MBK5952780.1 hypothetical protein [Rhodospirillum rubrum]QXG80917.1 hypothetical protein KUL73_02230 [Rhodospirillum rubrum]
MPHSAMPSSSYSYPDPEPVPPVRLVAPIIGAIVVAALLGAFLTFLTLAIRPALAEDRNSARPMEGPTTVRTPISPTVGTTITPTGPRPWPSAAPLETPASRELGPATTPRLRAVVPSDGGSAARQRLYTYPPSD